MVGQGISPALYRDIVSVLLDCAPIGDDGSLFRLFVDQRIRPWRNNLPGASSPRGRVDAVVDYLHDRGNVQGENALVLLLNVLADREDPQTECHTRLVEIARRLEQELGGMREIQDAAKGTGTSLRTVESREQSLYGAGEKWAVLVGVNAYLDENNYGRLQVCVDDVHAIRDALVAGGFDTERIQLLTDRSPLPPTRNHILSALQATADATEPEDLLLFYYSGHGDEYAGSSYLVARDGMKNVLNRTGLALADVREIVEGAQARAKIIILDACHSGANLGKGKVAMPPAFLRRVFEEAEGMVVLSSCQQGELSYEWKAQKRSVFTHYLLEALSGAADKDEKRFVTVQDANRYVVDGVKRWAARNRVSQSPTVQVTASGDIILTRYGEASAAGPTS